MYLISCQEDPDGDGDPRNDDTDGDGVCDELEIAGCVVPGACNYATGVTDLAPCVYADPGYLCDGTCDGDADGDDVYVMHNQICWLSRCCCL